MTISEDTITYWHDMAMEMSPVVPCEVLIDLVGQKLPHRYFRQLHDEDIAAIAVALGRHCHECRARNALKELYAMSEEQPLRRLGAVLGLESHRKARVARIVLQVAASMDPDETVKAEAVRILACPG